MALPTLTAGAQGSVPSASNATDIAGSFTITTTAVAGIICTLNYGYAYVDVGSGLSACQVILTPTNANAATDMDKIYISSNTTTGFVVSSRTGCVNGGVHTYNYHVIETQSGNGTGSFPGLTFTGAWATATVTQGTDIAGRITATVPSPTNGTISIAFGRSYVTAPIVVLQAYDTGAAQDIAKWWVSSTTTTLVIHFAAGMASKNVTFAYHVIETQ